MVIVLVRSSTSTPFIRMPSRAPRPVPAMIATGVASPSEQGQATMTTATAAVSPRTGSPAISHQPAKAASATWARGDNLVTIRATATGGWAGGTASLDVPWPPAPAAAALRQVRAMTVYERVTSDTALGPAVAAAVIAAATVGVVRLADPKGSGLPSLGQVIPPPRARPPRTSPAPP